eukprot:TRINITY_DN19216_c1_g2_i4.p1 TRINITY_DN19216_c1_g2~~TRINITY_DN19216_c1_g2_i4.p1  ORF type:complete len:631 (+),score=52.32 TRINITY_DN19216_c1_g2_i4:88-1980(+)
MRARPPSTPPQPAAQARDTPSCGAPPGPPILAPPERSVRSCHTPSAVQPPTTATVQALMAPRRATGAPTATGCAPPAGSSGSQQPTRGTPPLPARRSSSTCAAPGGDSPPPRRPAGPRRRGVMSPPPRAWGAGQRLLMAPLPPEGAQPAAPGQGCAAALAPGPSAAHGPASLREAAARIPSAARPPHARRGGQRSKDPFESPPRPSRGREPFGSPPPPRMSPMLWRQLSASPPPSPPPAARSSPFGTSLSPPRRRRRQEPLAVPLPAPAAPATAAADLLAACPYATRLLPRLRGRALEALRRSCERLARRVAWDRLGRWAASRPLLRDARRRSQGYAGAAASANFAARTAAAALRQAAWRRLVLYSLLRRWWRDGARVGRARAALPSAGSLARLSADRHLRLRWAALRNHAVARRRARETNEWLWMLLAAKHRAMRVLARDKEKALRRRYWGLLLARVQRRQRSAAAQALREVRAAASVAAERSAEQLAAAAAEAQRASRSRRRIQRRAARAAAYTFWRDCSLQLREARLRRLRVEALSAALSVRTWRRVAASAYCSLLHCAVRGRRRHSRLLAAARSAAVLCGGSASGTLVGPPPLRPASPRGPSPGRSGAPVGAPRRRPSSPRVASPA